MNRLSEKILRKYTVIHDVQILLTRGKSAELIFKNEWLPETGMALLPADNRILGYACPEGIQ